MREYGHRKNILVTGGAGFLGSHLIDRLLARGDEVICVDNLFTGTKRNIEHLHTHPRFEFLRHDVTFPLFIEVDEIFNLACSASPRGQSRLLSSESCRGALRDSTTRLAMPT